MTRRRQQPRRPRRPRPGSRTPRALPATRRAPAGSRRCRRAAPGLLAPEARRALARVYVPNSQSNTVDVIDQRTARIVGHFATGGLPQHVTPSWDLRTLWVTNDIGNSLTPIDPRTARPGGRVAV